MLEDELYKNKQNILPSPNFFKAYAEADMVFKRNRPKRSTRACKAMNDHRRWDVSVHLSPQFKFRISHISTCKTRTCLTKPYHCVPLYFRTVLLQSNSKKNQWLKNATVSLSQVITSSNGKPKKPIPLKTRGNKRPTLTLTPTLLGNLGNFKTLTTWPPKLLVSATATHILISPRRIHAFQLSYLTKLRRSSCCAIVRMR